MTQPIWTPLTQLPALKTRTEKHANLVHDLTTQLHEPVQSILSTLNRRAIALAKSANFETALHDATLIQQLSPSSAIGYICAASIYSEQGKQRQVIDVCNKGLSIVNTEDANYTTLQQAKADAEHRDNIRIDFVSQLCYEIVITALVPMFMDTAMQSWRPCSYLDVCMTWRRRIIQSLNGLHYLIEDEENEGKEERLSQVVRFARDIKSLYIYPYYKGTWLGDLLRNNDFCSLRELSIDDLSTDCGDHLVASLKSISDTLTHFEIEQEGGSMLSIGDILQNCTNLISLRITQPWFYDLSRLPMTTWPKLTTLSLSVSSSKEVITRHHITTIGMRFPALKELSLSPCVDELSTSLVLSYYPWMKSLQVLKYGVTFDLEYLDEGAKCEEGALSSLLVELCDIRDDNWGMVSLVLHQHQGTLQEIDFDIQIDTDDQDYLRSNVGFGWQMPHYAPQLEVLKMTADAIKVTPQILEFMPPNLKTLELDFDLSSPLDDKAPIGQYLHRFAQHSHLKELVVRFRSSDTIDIVLNAIHHLGLLQHLMISFPKKWDFKQMQSFLQQLPNGCPRLTCLELDCDNPPSSCSLNALKRLEHLKQFAFSIEDVDGDDIFWLAIQTFTQLEWIRIHPKRAINLSAIRHLQEKRPDLTITLDKLFYRFE
ncbi:predicted protein [Lichtheimia corymbifera JMRC:FSU:9682]|uniref:F-box domain-containing protein n=1 Tax=Lichtheimia corymbifera JMRC:FSU:9682 TaxID=1263082 RepID=A0A068SBV0_9FUNG|nr:predicted protein [Lichtheimia corymbifera JMRC:FSU:9682]